MWISLDTTRQNNLSFIQLYWTVFYLIFFSFLRLYYIIFILFYFIFPYWDFIEFPSHLGSHLHSTYKRCIPRPWKKYCFLTAALWINQGCFMCKYMWERNKPLMFPRKDIWMRILPVSVACVINYDFMGILLCILKKWSMLIQLILPKIYLSHY